MMKIMQKDWMNQPTREKKRKYSLSTITLKELENSPDSPQKKDVHQKIEWVKNNFLNFEASKKEEENGTKFTDEQLEHLGMMVIFLPLEIMQKFVIQKWKKAVDENNDEILDVLVHTIQSSDLYYGFSYPTMSVPTMGTCSYAVLHAHPDNEELYNTALLFINLYYDYVVAKLTGNREEVRKQINEHKEFLKTLKS